MNKPSRRKFLPTTTGAIAATALSTPAATNVSHAAAPLKVCVFSRHLHWLGWEAMAQTAAEIGFDGVDLTLRPGGHVLPERAEQDLPKVADIIRRAGLALPMVTAGIMDADTPWAASMLRAISAAGITRYRWGGFKYDDSLPIPAQPDRLRAKTAKLAELNRNHHSFPQARTQGNDSSWIQAVFISFSVPQSPAATSARPAHVTGNRPADWFQKP